MPTEARVTAVPTDLIEAVKVSLIDSKAGRADAMVDASSENSAAMEAPQSCVLCWTWRRMEDEKDSKEIHRY